MVSVMDKPGRNEPCYCGSGKKYKQCHMAADLAAESEQRAWNDAARDLRSGIFEFADDERFDSEAGPAAERYWNGLYTADTLHLMSPSEAERFLDWFAFDYTLPSTGERIIDTYRRENEAKLTTYQSDLLAKWAAGAPMGGYELTGFDRQTLHLKEIVSGEALDVFEPSGHGNAPVGSIILGRPIIVQEHYEFFSMPAYIPTEEIGGLPQTLAAAQAADDSPEAAGFMRRHNVLLIHHALEQAQAAGRPPVARLDPRHAVDGGQPRAPRHQRVRIKAPTGVAENAPPQVQSHRKAI
ncbi:MAG: SEC-C domain-containing protein [Candidatus Promineofilum sp.]|uniref:YecA family protein n=1 Tax=Promineifilum sp. TaxID=2664178 RepID=UPI002411B3D3|nr:SEC-C domain-containing protein [Promineifilum sp.]